MTTAKSYSNRNYLMSLNTSIKKSNKIYHYLKGDQKSFLSKLRKNGGFWVKALNYLHLNLTQNHFLGT